MNVCVSRCWKCYRIAASLGVCGERQCGAQSFTHRRGSPGYSDHCCQTHIVMQNFVLIQPRTSPVKICKILQENMTSTGAYPESTAAYLESTGRFETLGSRDSRFICHTKILKNACLLRCFWNLVLTIFPLSVTQRCVFVAPELINKGKKRKPSANRTK